MERGGSWTDRNRGWIDRDGSWVDRDEALINREESWIDRDGSWIDRGGRWIDRGRSLTDRGWCSRLNGASFGVLGIRTRIRPTNFGILGLLKSGPGTTRTIGFGAGFGWGGRRLSHSTSLGFRRLGLGALVQPGWAGMGGFRRLGHFRIAGILGQQTGEVAIGGIRALRLGPFRYGAVRDGLDGRWTSWRHGNLRLRTIRMSFQRQDRAGAIGQKVASNPLDVKHQAPKR